MIKTRFAPSPTGYLHIGGLRTALYAYLLAKHYNGTFILRIEDTDQKREVEGATKHLIEVLEYFGITHDEGPQLDGSTKGPNGPYIQSQRTDIYLEHAEKLLNSGHAYRCFCTVERLDEMREYQRQHKLAPMYDRRCLDLADSEITEKIKEKVPFVIRQKIPYKEIRFKDLIRGNTSFHGKSIDDQVLVKSDGFPTYHLANVVDDHYMEITHVIRAEEWLPSTPKHLMLYEAFGWQAPEYAHLPLIINADRSKLSKRQGDVAVEDYIKKGYLKEAILNFIAFLGWHPGSGEKNEIFSLEELKKLFTLERVNKSSAIFNLEKLDWFNWRWRKRFYLEELNAIAKSIESTVQITEPRPDTFDYAFSESKNSEKFSEKRAEKLFNMVKENLEADYLQNKELLLKSLITVEEKILRDLKQVNTYINFYFQLPDYQNDLLTHEKMSVDLNQARQSLEAGLEALISTDWTLEAITESLLAVVQKLGIKNGQLFWPLRAALSGLEFSPGVFEVAHVLGKEETLNRIRLAINKINPTQ